MSNVWGIFPRKTSGRTDKSQKWLRDISDSVEKWNLLLLTWTSPLWPLKLKVVASPLSECLGVAVLNKSSRVELLHRNIRTKTNDVALIVSLSLLSEGRRGKEAAAVGQQEFVAVNLLCMVMQGFMGKLQGVSLSLIRRFSSTLVLRWSSEKTKLKFFSAGFHSCVYVSLDSGIKLSTLSLKSNGWMDPPGEFQPSRRTRTALFSQRKRLNLQSVFPQLIWCFPEKNLLMV